MNQKNQGNSHVALGNVPVKRKRGRPRKNQVLNHGENALVPSRDPSLNLGQNAPVPPGFELVNGNQPQQADPVDDINGITVGQVVSGVIDSIFDAGYLLTVRVGDDSDTALRGVVFKPGHFVPISAQNDVVPHIQMIRRNEIPLSTVINSQVQCHNPRSTGRAEQHVNLMRKETTNLSNEISSTNHVPRVVERAANVSASKGKQVSSVVAQPARPVASRGTVVPVVLQPVCLSNGIPPANQMPPVTTTQAAAHMVASKGKQVPVATLQSVHQSNGSVPANQMLTDSSQPQSIHQLMEKGLPNGDNFHGQATQEALHEIEARSMRLPGVPSETLLREVVKRIHPSPLSSKVDGSKSAGKTSIENCGLNSVVPNMDQPLIIKPLQTVQPDGRNKSASIPKPSENNGTGKIIEFFQENVKNKVHVAQQPTTGPMSIFHKSGAETRLRDERTAHLEKRFRASSV
ncbi:protein METABOLIC NETWORK MODULATOR 1 [Malania oleifera]|uniref:protein METABOLIC NETWORK MODULATOR 1 n=1 Tax=Malania oleifera TaxID=397392 RepID=UPI0025ADD29D|nr:protein METABOLIC NETWORK MODULATOR 1 [Malania oleifera]XP_057969464.1 protein METABOLIC NETWORK MODULATOR 1 [Malania oleifera]XP_057969470.1 protein METABOLIC NETWORK MODULATOR 1 [Malania oleifera]XP_057969473.1 protein METABOLIC NETWORK MODULATOR 1 [Malania oleifera]XP_057969480.1 protein METABOLIC NETWORK MODULATOR 1 [Malania oleifera]XP_057969482.1 protein METABOLIC NETWORK MODULATOR 1 [Malania oleifera]XP_057969485.1 protein METABOLIC NETWORK MODULATOR 1 [Malania oleifera]XP_05796949